MPYTIKVTGTDPKQPQEHPILLDIYPADLPTGCTPLNLLQNNNPRKQRQLVVRGESERVLLEACNFGPSSSVNQASYSYALVTVDEKNSTINIVGPCQRLSCKRSAKAISGSSSNLPAQETPSDYRAAQNALGEAFGTKKRRQAIHSLEKNQIDMSRLHATSAAFINRAIDETIVSRLPTPEPSQAGSEGGLIDNGVLPPYSITAEKAADCYPLPKICPESIWMALPQFDSATALASALEPGAYVKARLADAFGRAADAPFVSTYLHYLLRLFPLKEGELNAPNMIAEVLYGLDPSLHDQLLAQFTETINTGARGSVKRHKLPQAKRDRLAAHICALALHLDGFRVNVNELAEAMCVSATKAVQYFKAMGCAVEAGGRGAVGKHGAQIKFARLSAPLVFPRPALGKR